MSQPNQSKCIDCGGIQTASNKVCRYPNKSGGVCEGHLISFDLVKDHQVNTWGKELNSNS